MLTCLIKIFFFFKITIESCDEKIKSVEVQLVRVETCGCAEGYSKDGNNYQTSFKHLISYFMKENALMLLFIYFPTYLSMQQQKFRTFK